VEGGADGVGDELLDLGNEVSLKINAHIFIVCVQIFLEIRVAQLIPRLIPAIVFRILLHGIIRQMDHSTM